MVHTEYITSHPMETAEVFVARHEVFHNDGLFSSVLPTELRDVLHADKMIDFAGKLAVDHSNRFSIGQHEKLKESRDVNGWVAANINVMNLDAQMRAKEMGLELQRNTQVTLLLSPAYEDQDPYIHTDGPSNFPLYFYLAVVGADTRYYAGDYEQPMGARWRGPTLKDQVGEPILMGNKKILRGDFSTLHATPATDQQGDPRVVIRVKAYAKV